MVAELASELSKTKCYSVAVPGSHDARTVVANADEEGRELELVSMTDSGLHVLAAKAAALLEDASPVAVGYTIPLLAVVERANEMLILAGNGADELFGGYAKYLTSSEPEQQMRGDLEKAMGEAAALAGYASGLGKRIEFPFLDEEVRNLAASIPLDRKMQGASRKVVLREAAGQLSLPSQHRPKKAAQYSTGILRRMEELAKADGKSVGSWIASLDNLE